ncbi:hypothetical protein G983_01519 [Escherichia coli UMEA 3656-1]|uniref:MchS3 family protein n=1 Tax=Escherichia coli TaxID=562 RepID=UPI000390C399|nr:MchS3 family protein [Escherichia coli]EQZ56486.1 hypothetical protein G983_01519 [Escherichia coli UMEA 3656-1]
MYLTKKIIISMMLILTSAAFSSDPPALQQSLEKTTYFSIGMNGFIGYQSEGEKLYTYILTLDNPEEIFKNIIKNRKSTKESKIYAACGLYYLNVENIESLFNENDKQEYVSVLRGDILTKIKLNDILNSVIINGCNTKLISEHK